VIQTNELRVLPQKVAIVTGGASGLALAIAGKLISRGIFTVITGRDERKLKEAKTSLGELCLPLVMDMNRLDRIPGHIRGSGGSVWKDRHPGQ